MRNNNFTRVPILDKEDVSGEVAEMFSKWEETTGKVPEWARVMANCPMVLKEFFDLFKVVMGPNGTVPEEIKWKVAHQVSALNKCEYCVDVTEHKLKAMGLSEDRMKDILVGDDSLSPEEKAAVLYATETTNKAPEIDDAVFEELRKYYNDAQIVELTSVIGFFNYINRFNDALRVLPQ